MTRVGLKFERFYALLLYFETLKSYLRNGKMSIMFQSMIIVSYVINHYRRMD